MPIPEGAKLPKENEWVEDEFREAKKKKNMQGGEQTAKLQENTQYESLKEQEPL